MKPVDYDSVDRLNAKISEAQDLFSYWVGITDPKRFVEAAGQIAILKNELASLIMERKAFLNDL